MLSWLDRRWALRWRLLAATAAGALYVAAFPSYEQWYLGWICLVPLLWAIDHDALSLGAAFSIGWCFGVVSQLGALAWTVGELRYGSGLSLPLAVAVCVGASAAQGSLFAVWAVTVHVARIRHRVPLVVAAPVVLVVCEWLYPAVVPTYLASSQYRMTLLVQSLDVGGPLGLGFLLALSSAVIYGMATAVRRRRAAPVGMLTVLSLLVAADLVYGFTAVRDVDDTVAHADGALRAGIVQAGRAEAISELEHDEDLRRHHEQGLEVIRQGADLVIWPTLPATEVIRNGTAHLAGTTLGLLGRPLLFGALRHEWVGDRRRLYGAAFAADAQGHLVGARDKRHLVPFRDYVPWGATFPWLYGLLPYRLRLDRGVRDEPLEIEGVRYGALLSYEETLPGRVQGLMSKKPEILVALGDGPAWGRGAQVQLGLAALRAIEHRRFLLRAEPTGISAVIDPAGRIVQRAPAGARANLVARVVPLSVSTPYARFGDWPGYLCLAMALWWSVGARRRVANEDFASCETPRPAPAGLADEEPREAARQRRRATSGGG